MLTSHAPKILFLVAGLLLAHSQAYAWSCEGPVPWDYLNPRTKLPTNTRLFFLGTDEFSKNPSMVHLVDASNNQVPTTLKKVWEKSLQDNPQIYWELIPNNHLKENSTYTLITGDPKNSRPGVYGMDQQVNIETGTQNAQNLPVDLEIQNAQIFLQPYTQSGSDHSKHSSLAVSLKLKPSNDLTRVVLFAIWISQSSKGPPAINPKQIPPDLYSIHYFNYYDGGKLDETAAKQVEIKLGGPDPCGELRVEASLISKHKVPFYISIAPIDVTGIMGSIRHVLVDPKKSTTKKSIHIQ